MSSRIPAVADEIMDLFLRAGGEQYFGEAVTKLSHAEQCAWQAERAGADEELVLAALLHDIGHLLDSEDAIRDTRVGVINHDELGAVWLRSRGFSGRFATLVGGHVEAKRYLTAVNADYMQKLSPASKETLRLQGGPMDTVAADAFAAEPEARDMLRLRSWDEMAKDPAWTGPGIESYRARLVAYLEGLRPFSGGDAAVDQVDDRRQINH